MRAFPLVALACALAITASFAQRKKKKEEETQTLQLPKELPGAVAADTRRLSFFVTPLTAKGLLSAQIREALKALNHEAGNDPILKIRAFVAGTGDLRRVRDLVSEHFTDRRQPLPTLSLIRSGGLPLEGAQVVLEAIAAARKDVNPHGLVFFSAQIAASENPLDPVGPLTVKSLAMLRQAVKDVGAQPSDVVRVTCFMSSLDRLADSRKHVEAEYPRAALNYVQTQREPSRALSACEAVARLPRDPPEALRLLSPADLPREAGQAQAALVGAPRVVLTGSQVSFGYQLADARLAFDRLRKLLEQEGATPKDVAFVHYYPLSNSIAEHVRQVRADVFDRANPPAASLILFEGLPSMDAGFAVDAVAIRR